MYLSYRMGRARRKLLIESQNPIMKGLNGIVFYSTIDVFGYQTILFTAIAFVFTFRLKSKKFDTCRGSGCRTTAKV